MDRSVREKYLTSVMELGRSSGLIEKCISLLSVIPVLGVGTALGILQVLVRALSLCNPSRILFATDLYLWFVLSIINEQVLRLFFFVLEPLNNKW